MSEDLRDRLDATLSAVTPSPAPVDDAITRGRRIRWRRRAVVAAAAAAVAAIGVLIPLSMHPQAAPRPVSPARGLPAHYTVTVQPPDRGSPAGLIASGTVNGKAWQVRVVEELGQGPTEPAVYVTGTAFGPGTGVIGGFAHGLKISTPILFPYDSFAGGPSQAQYGLVRADVSYATVRFGDGAVLTLHPVTAHGLRMVAFAAPRGAPIVAVTAYSRSGEIATAIPLVLPGESAYFGDWLSPGQRVPGRVSRVIASGTAHGQSWRTTVYAGPWGICVNNGSLTCQPFRWSPVSAIPPLTPGVFIAAVTPPVARLVFSRPGGRTRQITPIAVGGQKFIADTSLPNGVLRWTAYNAEGKILGTGEY
jgi:hypothetical protein